MLLGNISWKFWKFRSYKDWYGKPCKRDWMAKVVFLIQMLPTFGSHCNHCFWDIRLKILSLPNVNMLFQLVLTKFFNSELFLCLLKVDHVITVMQRAYCDSDGKAKNKWQRTVVQLSPVWMLKRSSFRQFFCTSENVSCQWASVDPPVNCVNCEWRCLGVLYTKC